MTAISKAITMANPKHVVACAATVAGAISSKFSFDGVKDGVTDEIDETVTDLDREKDQEIAVCPGEGPRYGDFKCNHDRTHRVCAQLLDSTTS